MQLAPAGGKINEVEADFGLSLAPGAAKGTKWTGAMLSTNGRRASRKQTASRNRRKRGVGGQ